MHEPTLDFVGSASLEDDIVEVAATVRHVLGFDVEERRGLATWTDALRYFIGQADALGVLVMASGVVGSNNRRRLEPREFRGFALADPLAPLIFINAADTKAAQNQVHDSLRDVAPRTSAVCPWGSLMRYQEALRAR